MAQKRVVFELPIDRNNGGHGHVDEGGDGGHDGVGDTKYYSRIVVLHGQ